ncbi:MAG: hypothetical protein ACYCV7_14045 [Acidimicrobiales bacterium]
MGIGPRPTGWPGSPGIRWDATEVLSVTLGGTLRAHPGVENAGATSPKALIGYA